MLSSHPHDDPYLDIFPFVAVMQQLPVREELRHHWPTYRTMYSTGGNSSRMLKALALSNTATELSVNAISYTVIIN